jgi:hypothetical protein
VSTYPPFWLDDRSAYDEDHEADDVDEPRDTEEGSV